MTIVKMLVRRAPNGKNYYTHVLVKSERPYRRATSRLVKLLNLGSDYPFPQERWKGICQRLNDILLGQSSWVAAPVDVEREAQHLAKRMLKRRGATSPGRGASGVDCLAHPGAGEAGAKARQVR